MPVEDLTDWLSEFSRPGSVWYVKRLAANDTLATGSHQGGPYLPKELVFELFPELKESDQLDPDVQLDAYIDSHADHRPVRIVWYNSRVLGKGTRNEVRVTRWGGSSSALLDPESTGSVAVFAFPSEAGARSRELHVWVCNHATEEDLIEDRIGIVEPGRSIVWRPGLAAGAQPAAKNSEASPCQLAPSEIPESWKSSFPEASELVRISASRRPAEGRSPGQRLLIRRACEAQLFKTAELEFEGRALRRGYESVDEAVGHAQAILQRRRKRSETSLLLQLKALFAEEGLVEGKQFDFQSRAERGTGPDFVFPSLQEYRNENFSALKLRVLVARTTCKTRWKAALDETSRVQVRHLLTLQEGVSEQQFREMQDAGVALVVPSPLLRHFPESIRPDLVSLQCFIDEVRHLRILD